MVSSILLETLSSLDSASANADSMLSHALLSEVMVHFYETLYFPENSKVTFCLGRRSTKQQLLAEH